MTSKLITLLLYKYRHVTTSSVDDRLHSRIKLDRRHLETAHLLYAFLTIQLWYPNAFEGVQYQAGDLDGVLLDITPMYHSIFSKVYAGENNKQ